MKNNKFIKILIVLVLAITSMFSFVGCLPKTEYKIYADGTMSVVVGDSKEIGAVVVDYDGAPNFTYTSNNENVVTIENGYLIGVSAGEAVVTVSTTIDGETITTTINVTVNAKQTATATFMVDGEVYDSAVYEVGSAIALPTAPTKASTAQYDYTFDGWEGYETGDVITGNVTYTAKWISTLREYVVTFKNGDEVYHSATLQYGASITLPENTPTKEGNAQYSYTFEKWEGYTAGATVSGNIEYDAVFTVSTNSYTVKFIANGVTVKEETLLYGAQITLPTTPTKEGDAQYSYTFERWEGYTAGDLVSGNVEYEAVFTPSVNSYTVVFKANGIVIKEETLAYGSAITAPETNPTKEGNAQYSYAFDKWDGYENGATVSGNVEYEAVFIPSVNSYTIKFISEGEIVKEETLAYGSVITAPETNPTKEGNEQYSYAFDKWLGYEDGALVSGDVVYEASFTVSTNGYKVVFKVDNEIVKETELAYGEEIIPPYAIPTKEGDAQYSYTFIGWAGFESGALVSGNAEYEAQFSQSINEYVVVFKANGIVIKEEILAYGTAITAPETIPTKEGNAQYSYTFTGWAGFEDGAVVAKNTEYDAQFSQSVNTYTVKFISNGEIVKEETLAYGSAITAPETIPTKEGNAQYSYAFEKWLGYEDGATVSGNVEYEAVFTVSTNSYTIKFTFEGNVINEETLLYGATINAPASIAKEGDAQYSYTFIGWAGFEDGAVVTKNAEYEAQFSQSVNTYTIKFISNGEIVKEETLAYGSTITAPETIPTKESTVSIEYTFTSWKNYEEGSVVTKNAEYEAQFSQSTRKYDVTIYENGEQAYSTKAEYGTLIIDALLPFANSVENGYEYSFEYEGDIVVGEVTVVATKTIKSFTVAFISSNEEIKSEVLCFGTIITAPDAVSKAPTTTVVYTFVGWTSENGNAETLVDFSKEIKVQSDAVYYAYFSESVRKYVVTFSVDDEVYSTYEREYGEAVILPETAPTKEETASATYNFVGWKNYEDGAKVYGDVEYEAIFTETLKKFTVTFTVDGAEYSKQEGIEFGDVISSIQDPTKAEDENSLYIFSHWSYGGAKFDINSPIVEDVELYAVFSKAYRTTGKVVLPTSSFNENYITYTNVKVVVDGKEFETQNGEFNVVLSAGEHTITTSCAGFKSITKSFSIVDSAVNLGDVQVVEHDLALTGMASNENGVITPGANNSSTNNQALVKSATSSKKFALRYVVNPTSLAYNGSKNKDMFIGFSVGTLDVMINRNNAVRFLISRNYDSVNNKTYSGAKLETLTQPYALTLIVDRTEGFNLSFYINDAKVFDDDLSAYNWNSLALPTGDLKVGVFYNTSAGNYTSAPITFTNFDYSFTPSVVSAWESVDLINVTGKVALPQTNIFGENYLNYYDYTDVTVSVNGTIAKVNEDFTFSAEVRPGSINVTVSATDFASVSKNYESATDLAIAQTIELEHNEWIYTTGSNMTASSEMKAENGVISYQTVGSTNYQIAKYSKETNSNKIIITQRVNPQEYWKAGTDKQQPIFFIQDATTPKNNLAIIWLGNKLRFLINLDWNNSVTDKTFTENTTVNTQRPTEPFTLTAIIERNASAKTFVLKMYVDDKKVYEGDVSNFTNVGKDNGTAIADYKAQLPYSNAYIGVGSNWSSSENYEGNPFVTDRVGYSYNSEVIELFEKSKKSYTVTFKAENGSELKSETLKFGSKITPYANQEKASDVQYTYTFAGWKEQDKSDENVIDFATYTVQGETVLVPVFNKTLNSYTVKFVSEGVTVKEETLAYGSIITLPASPTKEGNAQYSYTFERWDGYENGAPVSGNVEYEAVFTPSVNSYTIKFISEGEIVKEETLAYGSDIIAPETIPTKEGNAQYSYTFDKWSGYELGATVSGNAEYEAVFSQSVNSYTVVFKANGIVIKEETLAYGATITKPETIPTKEGDAQYTYAFEKWSGYELGATVSGNAEFVAEFSSTVNEYTIIFYNEDGQTEFERRENVPYGTVITAPESVPTKESDFGSDYEFASWSGYTAGMTVSGNHSFVAVFSATNLEYEITFKNGDEIIKQETLAYGSLIIAPDSEPTKEADKQYTYTFKGWKNFVAGETTVIGIMVFEAEFISTLRQYSVKVGDNDATLYDYGSLIENPGDAIKESTANTVYTFDGWYNGEEKWNFDTDEVTDNVTLVARFNESARKYTVSYIVDGEEIDSEDVEYNGVATKSASATKESTANTVYTFDAWYNGDVKWDFENDTVQSNVTLVARFNESVRKYTVSYIVDGVVVDEEEVEYNANATLASVSKESEGAQVYTFKHWSTTEGGEAFDGKVLKAETLYAVFEVAYRTSGKLGFASGFADNYSLYNIDDSVVTIADNSVSVGSDGNFEQILSAGTYTLTATHGKFESVSATLTVSDTEYEWGEIKFENHLMTLDRITYENGVLTPKTGSGTTYQTALFSNDITSNIFAIRQKVNPVSGLYMTNSEQIGFRIDGGNNKKVNLLVYGSKLRVMFNNTFDNYSEVNFVDTTAGINSKTEPYYLSAVVQRSATTFVVSIFVDDALMLSVDLAGVNVNYSTTGVSYSYSDYIPFSETVKVGAMINYSNNKYTSVPLTLSDADYSVDANAIESYFNGKVGIAGRISLPSDLLGEDYVDEYGSAVSVKVNGVKATLNTANGLFTAVVDKNSTVTISASASGAFVASEKTKTVQDVTMATGNIGVIALEGYIGKTGFTLSASNTIDENGHIVPKDASYQRALIKPNAKATTFVVKHTVNPNDLYVAVQEGKGVPNPQHGVAITDGTNILVMVIENKNMRFISTSNNKSQNVSGASSNPSLTTLTSAYTLTYFITVTKVDSVTTYALDVYLTYTVSGSEKTIKLFDKSNCKVDTTNTASVVIPTGTITGVGACWHFSSGKYPAGVGFTVSDVHISDDAKVVSAEQTSLNNLVSGS